jgi:hypothetical protein
MKSPDIIYIDEVYRVYEHCATEHNLFSAVVIVHFLCQRKMQRIA